MNIETKKNLRNQLKEIIYKTNQKIMMIEIYSYLDCKYAYISIQFFKTLLQPFFQQYHL